MTKFLLIFCLFLLAFIFFPKSENNINSPLPIKINVPKPKPYYSAWLPYWDEDRVLASLENTLPVVTDIRPFWYLLNSNGVIEEIKTPKKNLIIKKLQEEKAKVLPAIGNNFDPKRVSLLLQKENYGGEIEKLIALALEKNYIGYDLDWEEISASDKDAFSAFVKKLAEELHQNSLKLTVTVHAKSQDVPEWEGSRGQDYKSLKNIADQITIMIYDFHNSNSDPGPVTPTDDLKKTIIYALGEIPKNKIVVALPTYGYDWIGRKGTPIQYQDAQKLIGKYSLTPNRTQEALNMFYTDYLGNKHEVWYEDAKSTLEKINVAKSLGIINFTFWRLGGEDPFIWTSLPR